VAFASPLGANGQQAAVPVNGYLRNTSRENDPFRVGFHRGLKQAGFVEGQNVVIEYRWADYHYDRLSSLAADLARRQVAVIFTMTIAATKPAKAATTTIPIVFAIGDDPVRFGLVATFNRPGGNVTGVSWLGGSTLAAKRLELLHELAPTATIIALLVNPNNPAVEAETREVKEAARSLGLQVDVLNANTEPDINLAYARLVSRRVGALLVATDLFFASRRDQLVTLAERHVLPTMYSHREFADAGGLVTYGTDLADAARQSGVYVGRILKGSKPADLPVIQVTKVELVINSRTARALSIAIPRPLIGRADEVIE